jgi:hypothetical protein
MFKAFVLGLAALALIAAEPAQAKGLFSDKAPLTLVLTAPFRTIVPAAKTRTDDYPATLQVGDGAGPAQTLAIQIRARGNTRRTAGYCQFPPIELRFGDKDQLKGTPFKGQKKLKLVTYCKNLPDYEQRIVLEHLAYRLYNVITPVSFRVRGAEVTYRDGPNDKGVTRFGFVIEDLNDLADRNGEQPLEVATRQITPAQFDQHQAARAALFEYMIGNLDWDFTAGPKDKACCHNTRLVAASDKPPLSRVQPVPYDFDYSGFVDSPYAGPPEGLPVDSVTERLYRGYCASTGEMESVIAEYRAHKAEMIGIVTSEPHLDGHFRDKTVRFLDGFFATLDDPGKVQSQIIQACREGPH